MTHTVMRGGRYFSEKLTATSNYSSVEIIRSSRPNQKICFLHTEERALHPPSRLKFGRVNFLSYMKYEKQNVTYLLLGLNVEDP